VTDNFGGKRVSLLQREREQIVMVYFREESAKGGRFRCSPGKKGEAALPGGIEKSALVFCRPAYLRILSGKRRRYAQGSAGKGGKAVLPYGEKRGNHFWLAEDLGQASSLSVNSCKGEKRHNLLEERKGGRESVLAHLGVVVAAPCGGEGGEDYFFCHEGKKKRASARSAIDSAHFHQRKKGGKNSLYFAEGKGGKKGERHLVDGERRFVFWLSGGKKKTCRR